MNILIMISGFMGGVLNFGSSFYTFFLGDLVILTIDNAGTLQNLCFVIIPLSVLGIAGSMNVKQDIDYAGMLMLVSSLGVLFVHSSITVVGSLLLLSGGVLSRLQKRFHKRQSSKI